MILWHKFWQDTFRQMYFSFWNIFYHHIICSHFFTRVSVSNEFGFNVNTQGVMMVTPWLPYWLTHGYEVRNGHPTPRIGWLVCMLHAKIIPVLYAHSSYEYICISHTCIIHIYTGWPKKMYVCILKRWKFFSCWRKKTYRSTFKVLVLWIFKIGSPKIAQLNWCL